MTPTEQDKELREKLLDYFASGAPSYKIANQSIKANARIEVAALMPLIDQYTERVALEARVEGEKIGAFMAALSILSEMAPLMVHRLEQDFPSMTAEVIGTVYETVKKEMKPYQDSRKAQQEENGKS